ncbi:MAG: hypothetical protein K9G63_17235 [Melioribacteraceae bacterium]|nr:hypothetical protein [Melioribacteraceae bacterium]
MTNKIKKLSMTNTKKELLEAYNEIVKSVKEQEELQLNPQKIAEEKTKKEVVKKVEGINLNSIPGSINNLKSDINSTLNNLERNLEAEVKKYDDIRIAIQIKEKELHEVFEIEKSAHTLAALIESQNIKKIEFEEEMELKKTTTLKEIETLRAEWEREKQNHEAAIKERDEKEKREAVRLKEEFDYNFKREKQIAHDKLDDELKRKEKEFNELVENKTQELNKREAEISEKEKHYETLQKKLDQLQKELDTAAAKAVDETTKKLSADYKNKYEFLSKEFEGEKNVLVTKIEAYEKLINEQENKISELGKKLDQAYSKVQDIAVKTIESAGNAKTLADLQKTLADKFSPKVKE